MFFVESPALPGSYAYGLEARGGSWSGHAQAMVHVFPGPARLAIIDSDTLLFGRNPGPAVAAGLALASPAEGAAEAVRKIASACGIVYLSGMHETSTQGLRAWLLRGGFPPGAILPRDDTLADLGVFEFKRRRIEEIKLFWRSDWVGLCAGRVEAEAFFACGVRAFAVGLPAGSEPRGILRAATLAEAAGLIAK